MRTKLGGSEAATLRGRIEYLEDILLFLARDEDTWFGEGAGEAVVEALTTSERHALLAAA